MTVSGSILLGAVAALTETIEINCRACPCNVHSPTLSALFGRPPKLL